MSRLAEIYKSEKNRGGGLGSTLGKAALEKIDPRKMFNQQGLMAAMLPSLFKAYNATPKSNTMSSRLTAPSLNTGALESQMDDIAVNTRLTAKNTMVLPMMARDSNLTKLNIMKLVKLQGGQASKKSDMFWKDSATREKEYESKFSKEKAKTPKTSFSGGSPAAAGGAGGLKGIGLDFLSSLAGGIGKGVGIAAIGLGIGGFFAGLAAGGAAVTALGGAKGVKDMLVNLAEGLGAFSGTSLLAFGALLGAGMLFGPSRSNPVSGLGKGLNMSIGIASIGLGLGGFLAGLALGGAGIDALGGSGGVKQMMVDLAEGLNAFNPSSMAAFGTLLAAGGLFGVVTGVDAPVGLAMMGGTMLGMTAIGLGLGGFLAGLALGGKGIDMLGGGRGVKDMLVNLAEGLNAFGVLDAGNLAKLALAIPAFGVGMLGFFGLKGIAGIVESFTDGMKGVTDWIFGNSKTSKTPMQQLAEDLKLFENINGDNLSKVGQGFKDLASGLLGFAKVTEEDLARAKKAVEAGAVLTKNVPPTTTAPPELPSAPSTTSTSPTADMSAYKSRAGVGRESSSSTSPTPTGKNSLLDMIAKGESAGAGGYNAMNQGTPGGGPVIGSGDSQKIINKKLTDMTVGEIMDRAANPTDDAKKRKDGGLIFAAGRYQIIPDTLKGLVKQGVVSKDDKFDEATQDKLGMALIQGTGALKLAAKGDYEGAQNAMAKTWASIPLATDVGDKKAGQSYYQKAGQNTAHAGLDVKGALMASSPSTGVTLASASTTMSDQRMAAMAPSGGNTVINNKPVNVASNAPSSGGKTASTYDNELFQTLVGFQSA
jgi:hypothetical protein